MTDDAVTAIRSRLAAHSGRYKEISGISGLSFSYISKLARGDRGARMSFESVSKLTAALDQIDGGIVEAGAAND